MAQGYLIGIPQRLGDENYDPADAWKVYTWTADGTFTTALTTYSDAALTTPHTNPIIMNAEGYFATDDGITSGAFVESGLRLDIQIKNAAGATILTLLSQMPMASPTSVSGAVVGKSVTFAETATGVLHTATIAIPADATLLDIQVSGGALWGAGAAVLDVGDTADPNGYFASVNLKASDLLAGEVLSVAGSTNNWGAKNGAYLNATTGQRGPTTSNFGTRYVAGSNILATVTVTTPSVTTGRTYLTVFYASGITVAPVVT